MLVAARLVQGFSGAGGMVIGRAVIADIVTGRAAAKAFTLMLTVGGIAPVLAPLVGGLLAGPVGWRGMLWTVAGLCAAMLLGVVFVLHETHPPERRTTRDTSTLSAMRTVVANHAYRGPVAVFALSFGVMMAYIASSPFVYQNVVGLSEVEYGIAFGLNAAGLIGAGWVASHQVDRWAPVVILRASIALQLAGTLAFVVLAVLGRTDLDCCRSRSSWPCSATAGSWGTPPRWPWPRSGRSPAPAARSSASPSSRSVPWCRRWSGSAARTRRWSRRW